MVGHDVTSSKLELPPLKPLEVTDLTSEFLYSTAKRIIEATWRAGLPQWSWGEGVYLLSEIRFYEVSNSSVSKRLINWITGQELITSGHINNVAPGAVAARLDALELLDTREICDSLQSWVMDDRHSSRASNGAVEHWPDSVWADTCYMLGSFLLNQGVAKKDHSLIEFVGDQISKHFEILQNADTKLCAHGSHRGETIWNYWGRGNAWMALASVEFLDACNSLSIKPTCYKSLMSALENQLKALISLLPDYGIWDVLVDHQVENRGILETSATAGIGAAMIRAAKFLPEIADDLISTGRRAAAAALTYVDSDGVLTRTSAGTVLQLIPFGYSVIRSDRLQLWGQGLALNAITALLDSNFDYYTI